MLKGHFKVKVFLFTSVLIGLLVLVIALVLTFNKQQDFLPKTFSAMDADIQIRDFAFIETQEGQNQWEIKAQKAEIFEKQKEAVLNKLEVRYSSPEGFGMTFYGEQGRLNTEKQDFQVFSEGQAIEVAFNNGYKLSTQSIRWTNQERRILTEDPIEIQGPGLKILGKGLEASLESQELKVLSNVRAEVF
jgi:LPS export ABC transporter protein LptC